MSALVQRIDQIEVMNGSLYVCALAASSQSGKTRGEERPRGDLETHSLEDSTFDFIMRRQPRLLGSIHVLYNDKALEYQTQCQDDLQWQ